LTGRIYESDPTKLSENFVETVNKLFLRNDEVLKFIGNVLKSGIPALSLLRCSVTDNCFPFLIDFKQKIGQFVEIQEFFSDKITNFLKKLL